MRFKADKHEIFLGYTVFIIAYFVLASGIGITYLTGEIPIPQKPHCTFGLIGIDGAFDCVWQYLQPLFVIFDLSSSIGLINWIILIPYLMFMVVFIIELIKP